MKGSSQEKRATKPKVKIKGITFQGKDFVIEYENQSDSYSEYPNMYACALYLPKTVNKGKYNERTELKYVWYPTSKQVLDDIIIYRILSSGENQFKGKGDEGLALFLDRYKEERSKLVALFNKSKEEWMNTLEFDKKKKTYKVVLE